MYRLKNIHLSINLIYKKLRLLSSHYIINTVQSIMNKTSSSSLVFLSYMCATMALSNSLDSDVANARESVKSDVSDARESVKKKCFPIDMVDKNNDFAGTISLCATPGWGSTVTLKDIQNKCIPRVVSVNKKTRPFSKKFLDILLMNVQRKIWLCIKKLITPKGISI